MQVKEFQTDWIEDTTAALIQQAKRCGFFHDVMQDAKYLQETEGYAWDVALKISLNYWAS